MLKKIILAACTLVFASSLWAATNPKVLISTTLGDIEVELNAEKAPISVKNFLGYVDSGFYKGTQFHRVIPGFMIQGGGFDADMKQKQTGAPIRNEADNGFHKVRGNLSMARTQVRASAPSQFFTNHKENAFPATGSRDFGYAVFGKVIKGMNVVDEIAQVPTGNRAGMQNVPREPVMILDIKRL
ncbi:peptidylprolyl isomerase A [Pseudomonas sp. S9]|uniref:peptidylprolyl isomerase A n=1 Tax=Pseudomonas sp. S9 TaxID=686578 RepID=UPI0002556FD5|nr:peptidylprolyl isomerase A [Pseudomonas sp. S9]